MNDLILHPEYGFLLKEIEGLKNDIVMIRTRIDRIQTVEEIVYRTEYHKHFGQLEYEIASKYYQYCLLKRKLEMIQMALNHGKEPNMNSINLILNAEAEEYNAILMRRKEELKNLSQINFISSSNEEIAQSKVLYQKIVRALHPDLNPNATKEDCESLQQAVEAFATGDIATLEAISAVLEFSGKLESVTASGSMEDLRKRRVELSKTAENLANQLHKIKNSFPMNQVPLLSDRTLVNKRLDNLMKESEMYDMVLDDYNRRIESFEKETK